MGGCLRFLPAEFGILVQVMTQGDGLG